MAEASTGVTGPGGFRGAWRHTRWRWLLGSFAISMTGDFLYFVALVVFLIEATGSTVWVAVSAIVRILVYVVLSPFGGALADRYDRRRLMIVLDLARAGVMTVIAAVVWVDGPPALVVALCVLSAVFTVPHRPAAIAATPLLVPEDDLAAANAAESVIASLAFFAGPALGAAVVAAGDVGTAFAVNALTFAVSAVLVTKIGDVGGGEPQRQEAGSDDGEPASTGLLADVVEGARIVGRDRGLLALTMFIAVLLFQVGVEQVVHVLVAQDRLGMDAGGVGVLAAAVGVGGLLIAPFTARLGRARSSGLMLAGAGAVVGLTFALLAVLSAVPPALLVLAVQGVGVVVIEVLYITLLQRSAPEAALARIYGLHDSITAATQLVGSVAAPILVATVGLEGSLWLTGAILVVSSVLLAPSLQRAATAAEGERRQLAPVVAQLRSLGIFGDASQAALERLARSSTTLTLPAGSRVFAEGDVPDDLYVVTAGELDVTVAGRGVVNRMAVGEWFGESGLLRHTPRTAAVTAATDVELLRISGATFLDVLTVPERLPDPLRLRVTSPLARTHPALLTTEDA